MKTEIKHSGGSSKVWIFSSGLKNYLRKEKNLRKRNAFIIIDSKVYLIHWKYINDSLAADFIKTGIYKIVANENNKSLNDVEKILIALTKSGADRDTLIISIGGGITGDIASFSASIYMRGIEYIHIPTTLLSMVDSSIGGKTGVNFYSLKNLIGTFYQPKAVFIDLSFLNSLPLREINSGVGEIIKYSFLSGDYDNDSFTKGLNLLLKKEYPGIQRMIYECIKIKSAVIETDEKEKLGLRKILNLGHTFAHGIESSSNFQIKHGEAVLFGIISSLFYSYRVKLISAEYLYACLLQIKPYLGIIKNLSRLVQTRKVQKYVSLDKKNSKNRINLVLLAAQGKIVVDYPGKIDLILNSLDEMLVWVKESFKKETVEK